MDKKGERRLSDNATFYYLFTIVVKKLLMFIMKHQNQTTARTDENDRANA